MILAIKTTAAITATIIIGAAPNPIISANPPTTAQVQRNIFIFIYNLFPTRGDGICLDLMNTFTAKAKREHLNETVKKDEW